jgi:hypothetical protein
MYSGLARDFYAYHSDDGNVYNVATDVDNGAANGATSVAPGANPTFPRGWVMRHVYGNASGVRTKLPILLPTNTLYTSGGTFSKASLTFTVEGKIGEKRMNRGG